MCCRTMANAAHQWRGGPSEAFRLTRADRTAQAAELLEETHMPINVGIGAAGLRRVRSSALCPTPSDLPYWHAALPCMRTRPGPAALVEKLACMTASTLSQASRSCWASVYSGRGCLHTRWHLSVLGWQMHESCKLLMHVLTLGCAGVQGRWSVPWGLYRLVCALISLSEPRRGFRAVRNFEEANEHPLVVRWKLFMVIDFMLMMYTATVLAEARDGHFCPIFPGSALTFGDILSRIQTTILLNFLCHGACLVALVNVQFTLQHDAADHRIRNPAATEAESQAAVVTHRQQDITVWGYSIGCLSGIGKNVLLALLLTCFVCQGRDTYMCVDQDMGKLVLSYACAFLCVCGSVIIDLARVW